MSKYDDLVSKLKEIFQIDRPELDFGVYRILNARANEINDYLNNRLKAKVADALAKQAEGDSAARIKELISQIKDEYGKRAFDEEGKLVDADASASDQGQELLRLRQGSQSLQDHENAVFSHLLTFFSRYYDSGDFISRRRYKGDTYAVPYAGEEVMLHWANKDQYYTKSGENFANYSFKLADGRTVHLRLVAADTAKDNRKDNDKERRFVLIDRQTRVVTDEEGDEYEEELFPVEEADGDLLLRFEYRPMPKGTKQDDLVNKAVQAVLGSEAVKTRWLDLAKREPTEKNPQRTLLEKHLTTYTQKNSADYFIHKDLGRFLRGELDFYIKNEVMNLDDVQNAVRFGDIEKNLRMIQCLRAIALELVTFLAQLEDFQKKLWLKKKFVVAAHYCITLDRVIKDVPELLDAIAANQRQWEQWENLGMLKEGITRNCEYLKGHQFLMVDTTLFDTAFRDKLLGAINNLDESLDGLLIHGDNFQALNLLQERFTEQVKCVYIDPPYNAKSSEILYKNNYKHSSWLSLMDNRFDIAKVLLDGSGVFVVAIDEVEQERLGQLLSQHFPSYAKDCIVVNHNPSGQQGDNFSFTHEYAYFVYPTSGRYIAEQTRENREEWDERNFRDVTGDESLRAAGKNCFYPIIVRDNEIVGFGDVCPDDYHPNINEPNTDGTISIFPIDPAGIERKWRFARDTVEKIKNELKVHRLDRRGVLDIKRLKKTFNYKSNWVDPKYSANNHGTQLLNKILPKAPASYPKSIFTERDCIYAALNGKTNAIVMDYFAGSGTTGHAVISQNRDDNGKRKYILVEQGEYFDTVLKPRIQKVVYSADWQDGKATASETGISHAFKVLKIESYEDTLNNLQLRRSDEQKSLLDGLGQEAKDDYLVRYMLDIESRGSILSVDSFRKPFDCTLKVAVDSAGACEERSIDLVETFNYLIGLKVKQIDSLRERGIVMVQGTLPTGEKTLVLWRDCEQVDYEALDRFCDSHDINPRDSEFEVVYINGDHNIPSVLTTTEEEGGITKILKLRQIEPEFLSRMFDGEV